jgi:hypothetical protein
MASGWLSPWAIWQALTGKWQIKTDDPLVPAWEFPNRSGVVVLSTSNDPYANVVEHFNKILAVDLDYIVAAEDLAPAKPLTCTLANQPDVPRTFQITFSHGANISAFNVTIIGRDAKGDTKTRTYTQADGWTIWTDIAFATVTSIIVNSITGTGVGETLNIGIWGHVGLNNKLAATTDVYKIVKSVAAGQAYNFVSTAWLAHTTYDTIDLEVTGNIIDGDSFTVYYKSRIYSL